MGHKSYEPGIIKIATGDTPPFLFCFWSRFKAIHKYTTS